MEPATEPGAKATEDRESMTNSTFANALRIQIQLPSVRQRCSGESGDHPCRCRFGWGLAISGPNPEAAGRKTMRDASSGAQDAVGGAMRPTNVDRRRRRPFRKPHFAVHRQVEFAGEADLAPVPLHKDPAVSSVSPTMRYPAAMRPWRLFPPSREPGVTLAIPTLVPGNPNMVTAGPRRPSFD